MNFHICGHSHHLYADVRVLNNNKEDQSCELSQSDDKFCDDCIEKCCDEESDCDDCSDIVKEVETDIEYVFTHYNLLVEIAEHEVFFSHKTSIIKSTILYFRADKGEHHTPPDSNTTSVWLC